jgi:ParB family transcriptional regulator, chromosome partitioning protein
MVDELARRRLGRGLASLIGDVETLPQADDRTRAPRRLLIASLRPNPRNPRKSYDAADLDELVQSVREKGVVQPILVRPLGNEFEIIAGERRWRAAQKAGLHEVPVVVHEVSDKEALELAIIENVQRSDLNPLEEAAGYQQLMDEFQYTQAQLAEIIGKSRPHIANTLRLLKFSPAVQDYLRSGQLTAGHARAIATLPDPDAAAAKIVAGGLSVREAEGLGETAESPRKRPTARAEKDADTRALEKQVSDGLGLGVTIAHKPDGGEVRIRYKTLEQLDDVCRRLRFS